MAMAKPMLALLLFAAQSVSTSAAFVRLADNTHVESNFRVQSNSSVMKTFSQSFWNNRVTNAMQHEVEMVKAKPPHVNKISYVLFAMIFGFCGCDRCFMGQILFGCLKGFTFGGFMVWHVIDYVTCVVSALSSAEEINMMGYHATFEKKSISVAFWLALILLLWNITQQFSAVKNMKEQRALQEEQQRAMLELMSSQMPKDQEPKESLDIPRRHQSLAYMPTMFTKGLRKAGIVTEKPSVPELIAAFDAMDKNGDGQLDHEEIKEGMKAIGMSDEAIDEMIKAADADGDGKISKNEFLISYHTNSEK